MKTFRRIRVKTQNGMVNRIFNHYVSCESCDRRGSYITEGDSGSIGLCLSCLFEEPSYLRIDLPVGNCRMHIFKAPSEYPLESLLDQIREWAEQVGNAHTRGTLNGIKEGMREVADDLERQVLGVS